MAYISSKHSSPTPRALWSETDVCDLVYKVLEDLGFRNEATVHYSPRHGGNMISISIPRQIHRWRSNYVHLIQQLGAGKDVGASVYREEIKIKIPLPLYKEGGEVCPGPVLRVTLEAHEAGVETLYELLTSKLQQNLETLGVNASYVCFPSVGLSGREMSYGSICLRPHLTKMSYDPPCLYPRLTTFEFSSVGLHPIVTVNFEHHLLEFLRNCPKLERICLRYGDKEKVNKFPTGEETPKLVELHSLCWFSHQSPNEVMPMGIFNRLSLEKTCNVLLEFEDKSEEPWDRNFPNIRDKSHLSGETTVEITCLYPLIKDTEPSIRAKFLNSEHEFSIQVTTSPKYSGAAGVKKVLPFLGRCEGIKVLHFQGCMHGKPRQVTSVFKKVDSIVKSRQGCDVPLQTVRVTGMDMEEWKKSYTKSLKALKKPAVEMIESTQNSLDRNSVRSLANPGRFSNFLPIWS